MLSSSLGMFVVDRMSGVLFGEHIDFMAPAWVLLFLSMVALTIVNIDDARRMLGLVLGGVGTALSRPEPSEKERSRDE